MSFVRALSNSRKVAMASRAKGSNSCILKHAPCLIAVTNAMACMKIILRDAINPVAQDFKSSLRLVPLSRSQTAIWERAQQEQWTTQII